MPPVQYLHGIDVVDVATGTRPINNVNMSIIGLVCTAPNAALGAVATLSMGLVASNNALTFDALGMGASGNAISVLLRNPQANLSPLVVSVSGTVITVDLATDATGLVVSTAAQVLAAIAAHALASLLVVVSHTTGSTGVGIVTPTPTAQFLTGGVDEAFPLDTPVRIASRAEAAALDTTGAGLGTGPTAIDDIFDQGSFAVVVVRVAEGVTVAQTKANIIGGVSLTGQRTGMQALLDAESVTGAKPKVLCAPGFTHDAAVVTEFVAIANRLLAVVVADCTNTTDADAINYRGNFGSPRVWLVDPWVKRFDVLSATNVTSPASARFAAVLASRGYWESPSNQLLNGIIGTARAISYALGDYNSTANFLNANQVSTIIRDTGYRVWGSRTCSGDPRFAFVSTVRTDDAIAEAIALSHKWAIDQGITKNFIEAVVDGINAYLQHEVALGHLIGGKAWVDAALNTPESLANGHIYFDYDFTDVKTAEHITMRKHLVNDYLKGLFK